MNLGIAKLLDRFLPDVVGGVEPRLSGWSFLLCWSLVLFGICVAFFHPVRQAELADMQGLLFIPDTWDATFGNLGLIIFCFGAVPLALLSYRSIEGVRFAQGLGGLRLDWRARLAWVARHIGYMAACLVVGLANIVIMAMADIDVVRREGVRFALNSGVFMLALFHFFWGAGPILGWTHRAFFEFFRGPQGFPNGKGLK